MRFSYEIHCKEVGSDAPILTMRSEGCRCLLDDAVTADYLDSSDHLHANRGGPEVCASDV